MVAAPIAAAFMLAPAIAVTAPSPAVVMDANAPCRTIVIAVAGMPAVAMAIASHIGRSGRSHRRQRGGAGNGAQCEDSELHSHLHRYEVEPPFPLNKRRNTLWRSAAHLNDSSFCWNLR